MTVAATGTIGGKLILEVYGFVRGYEGSNRLMKACQSGRATAPMTASAEQMGANAVAGVRMVTSGIMGGASEILEYGTAVRVE